MTAYNPFFLFKVLWSTQQYGINNNRTVSFQERIHAVRNIYRSSVIRTMIDVSKKGITVWFIKLLQLRLEELAVAAFVVGDPTGLSQASYLLHLSFVFCISIIGLTHISEYFLSIYQDAISLNNNILSGLNKIYEETISYDNSASVNREIYTKVRADDNTPKDNAEKTNTYRELTQKMPVFFIDVIVYTLLIGPIALIAIFTYVYLSHILFNWLSSDINLLKNTSKASISAAKAAEKNAGYYEEKAINATKKSCQDQHKLNIHNKKISSIKSFVSDIFYPISLLLFAYGILFFGQTYGAVWVITTGLILAKTFKEFKQYNLFESLSKLRSKMTAHADLVDSMAPVFLKTQLQAFKIAYLKDFRGIMLRACLYLSILTIITGMLLIPSPSILLHIHTLLAIFSYQKITTTLSFWVCTSLLCKWLQGPDFSAKQVSSYYLFSLIIGCLTTISMIYAHELFMLATGLIITPVTTVGIMGLISFGLFTTLLITNRHIVNSSGIYDDLLPLTIFTTLLFFVLECSPAILSVINAITFSLPIWVSIASIGIVTLYFDQAYFKTFAISVDILLTYLSQELYTFFIDFPSDTFTQGLNNFRSGANIALNAGKAARENFGSFVGQAFEQHRKVPFA